MNLRNGYLERTKRPRSKLVTTPLILFVSSPPCTCGQSFGLSTGLGTTIKYLRRTRNGAASNALGTTIFKTFDKQLPMATVSHTIKYLRGKRASQETALLASSLLSPQYYSA
jgi:hypothetical protein